MFLTAVADAVVVEGGVDATRVVHLIVIDVDVATGDIVTLVAFVGGAASCF